MAARVLPVVRLFFACDEAILDLADGKWTLKNPWHTVAMPPGVTEDFWLQDLWLYAQLTGGVGEFTLTVEMRDEAGLRVGRSPILLPREFLGGTAVVEEVFHLRTIPFKRPGCYDFVLLANHAELQGDPSMPYTLHVLPGETL